MKTVATSSKFTTKNVPAFFNAPTVGLSSDKAQAIRALTGGYIQAGTEITETAGNTKVPPLALLGMVGSYYSKVSLIIHGWSANAGNA